MQGYGVSPSPNPRGSTVGEGFSFGCGFLLAGLLASIGMGLVLFLVNLLMIAIGVGLFTGR